MEEGDFTLIKIGILLTIILVASSFPVGAAITNELPPAIIMFMRFLLAATLFAPYVFYKE